MNRTIELKAAKSLRCKDVALGEPRSADAYYNIPALCFMALPSKGAQGTETQFKMFDFNLVSFFIGLLVGVATGDVFFYIIMLIFKPSYARQYEMIKKQRSKEINVVVEYKLDDEGHVIRQRIWPCSGDSKTKVEDGTGTRLSNQ